MFKRVWGEPIWTDVDSFCAIVASAMMIIVLILLI